MHARFRSTAASSATLASPAPLLHELLSAVRATPGSEGAPGGCRPFTGGFGRRLPTAVRANITRPDTRVSADQPVGVTAVIECLMGP